MSVYRGDSGPLLRAALASVYANDLRPDAVQLVVDGPVTDEIDEVIGRFQAIERMRVLRLERNGGLARALNAGLAQVETAWVVRADADDVNLPGRFAAQAKALAADPDCGLLGGTILEIGADGEAVARRVVPLTHAAIVRYARWRNPLNHMTVAFLVEPVRLAGGYPEIHLKEDYALWASLLGAGVRATNLPQVLVHASAGRDMYRRRGGWKYARAELQLQLHLMRCGLKAGPAALLHGLARAIVFLLPTGARGLVYERLLRARVDRGGSPTSK